MSAIHDAPLPLINRLVPIPYTQFQVSGMTCNNCARHVREAIESQPDVANVTIELEAGRAGVYWKIAPNIPDVLAAIHNAGYEATAHAPARDGETLAPPNRWSPLAGWQFNVAVGLAVTLPLMAGEWIFGLAMARWFQWTAFALALFVQITCGARFYLGAWRQIKVGVSNMDTLVALGSTTALGYSTWALFAGLPGHLYFMEAAAIITLISLGHWFEARTSQKAETGLRALLQLAPATARRRAADGSEREVPVCEVNVGDLLILKPGDQVPVDGEVAGGGGTLDESMLTGESMPVEKSVGAKLYAGTVNTNGHLQMRVGATGQATALAHIIAIVTRAQNSRAEIQRLGDRVSSVFVPVVVTIALATALWWGLDAENARPTTQWLSHHLWPAILPATALAAAFIQAAAVLIIACPCAMGLATPVAIMAGTNAAARRGILVRDGVSLERAGKINAIVFDKTGTLTQGKPEIAERQTFDASAPWNVPSLAAALARGSNHPLSQAIAAAETSEIAFSDWQEIRGAGVEARLPAAVGTSEALLARLGSLRWLQENGVELMPGKSFDAKWAAQGATVLGLAVNRQLLASFALKDQLKPAAADLVRQLQRDGMEIFLATGDNAATAQAIAQQAGIDAANVLAEARPEAKAEFIQKLQAQGKRVAFVGDGINDAPALKTADLGIAVSRASDVARQAADMVLLKSDIQAVAEALGLARATLRTIKQNLFWAFFYNVIGIPLAAMGFLSPVLCAAVMGFSDLIVIGNALRLLRWKSK